MLHETLKTVVVRSIMPTTTPATPGPVVLTSTGDKFSLIPMAPLKVLKWGFLIAAENNGAAALSTGANGLVLKLDKRPTVGSDTNRATLDTLTVATNNTAYTIGKGAYRDPYTASTKSTVADQPTGFGPVGKNAPDQEAGQQQIQAIPGEELIVKVDTAASTTGTGTLWIEYVLLPLSRPSGYGTTDAGVVSLTENYTRLAS